MLPILFAIRVTMKPEILALSLISWIIYFLKLYKDKKKFLVLNNIKDDTLCLSAYKILNGANQSEVILTEDTPKKHSLFDKIFNFFDK